MLIKDSYQYDVFISYRNTDEHRLWLNNVFIECFRHYLYEALGREPIIFFDRDIESGSQWPMRLKSALVHSRILVPIWSAQYFCSEWCMSECYIMRYREIKLSYRTLENPNGLIHPVRLFDGEHYPQFAQNVSYLDCKVFNSMRNRDNNRFQEFLEAIESWTLELANAIYCAPPYEKSWLSHEWLDQIMDQWEKDSAFQMRTHLYKLPSLA